MDFQKKAVILHLFVYFTYEEQQSWFESMSLYNIDEDVGKKIS